MQGVLIDDHRIHVDFSQSVSKLSDVWRTATNSKRKQGGGGFGGISGLEKKSQYRVGDYGGARDGRRDRFVYDEEELRKKHERERRERSRSRKSDSRRGGQRQRSRSPRRDRDYDDRDRRRDRGGRDRDHYDDRGRDRDRDYRRR